MSLTTTTFKDAVTVPAGIQSMLEKAGLRRTLATRAVLGLFLAKPRGSLNHAQVFAALSARGLDINRVTLYRLLDRLVACGVLQRHADDDARTWYFCMADSGLDQAALTFECGACHERVRLPEASGQAAEMAKALFHTLASLGHRGQRLDVSLRGTCASCLAQGARA
jgi:Fur family transcriptional regulator, ferric uptake regulator